MSPSLISKKLFENVSKVKHLCVDTSPECCVDVAQISFTAFGISWRLETVTPSNTTNSQVENFES